MKESLEEIYKRYLRTKLAEKFSTDVPEDNIWRDAKSYKFICKITLQGISYTIILNFNPFAYNKKINIDAFIPPQSVDFRSEYDSFEGILNNISYIDSQVTLFRQSMPEKVLINLIKVDSARYFSNRTKTKLNLLTSLPLYIAENYIAENNISNGVLEKIALSLILQKTIMYNAKEIGLI